MMHDYTIINKVKFPKDDETVQIYSPPAPKRRCLYQFIMRWKWHLLQEYLLYSEGDTKLLATSN